MSRERRNREECLEAPGYVWAQWDSFGHTSSTVLESISDGGEKTCPFYPTTGLYSEPKEKGETTVLKVT